MEQVMHAAIWSEKFCTTLFEQTFANNCYHEIVPSSTTNVAESTTGLLRNWSNKWSIRDPKIS
jgi:hypothetical protein